MEAPSSAPCWLKLSGGTAFRVPPPGDGLSCADAAITHRVAAPHFVMGDVAIVLRRAGWQPGWELERVDWGAGGLIASLAHLLSRSRFQLTGAAADGARLLSAESLARLHTPVTTLDRERAVGLDWTVRHTDGVMIIEHGGEAAGYKSDLVVAPGTGVGVAVLRPRLPGATWLRSPS